MTVERGRESVGDVVVGVGIDDSVDLKRDLDRYLFKSLFRFFIFNPPLNNFVENLQKKPSERSLRRL